MFGPPAHPARHENGGTAWNAGFSRHPLREAQRNDVRLLPAWREGGRGVAKELVASVSGLRAIPADKILPPPAFGGLCRLKPAFQAGVPAVAGAARGAPRIGLLDLTRTRVSA